MSKIIVIGAGIDGYAIVIHLRRKLSKNMKY